MATRGQQWPSYLAQPQRIPRPTARRWDLSTVRGRASSHGPSPSPSRSESDPGPQGQTGNSSRARALGCNCSPPKPMQQLLLGPTQAPFTPGRWGARTRSLGRSSWRGCLVCPAAARPPSQSPETPLVTSGPRVCSFRNRLTCGDNLDVQLRGLFVWDSEGTSSQGESR